MPNLDKMTDRFVRRRSRPSLSRKVKTILSSPTRREIDALSDCGETQTRQTENIMHPSAWFGSKSPKNEVKKAKKVSSEKLPTEKLPSESDRSESNHSSSDNSGSILDAGMHDAIDGLSDDSGSEEDFTFVGGFQRAVREVAPNYENPTMTEEEFVQTLKAKHFYSALYKTCPPNLRFFLDTIRRLQERIGRMLTPSLKSMMSLYAGIYSTFTITFHYLYLASFSWQLILSNTHRAILTTDNLVTHILNDRSEIPRNEENDGNASD